LRIPGWPVGGVEQMRNSVDKATNCDQQ